MSATATDRIGSPTTASVPADGTLPLSVLIPVRNESRNLPRCLEAIQGWADEIVVVDSGSTDETVAIAEAAGATVIQFEYQGGWPKKRQWALDTHNWENEWILLLDADEILTEELKQEISEAIKDERYDGYWLCFRAVFLGRVLYHGDTDLWKLFLFRRGCGRYEQRLRDQDASMSDVEVHEHVVVNGPTRKLRHHVIHENMNSLSRYIQKHNEYSTWEARVLAHGSSDELPPHLFGNQAQRRRWLKAMLMRVPGSPLIRFLYIYIVRLGFLDGRQGFIFAMFKFVQTFHVKAKMFEQRVRPPEPPSSESDKTEVRPEGDSEVASTQTAPQKG
jgi:glycosyltransferase involved in cell wall biosynthesis